MSIYEKLLRQTATITSSKPEYITELSTHMYICSNEPILCWASTVRTIKVHGVVLKGMSLCASGLTRFLTLTTIWDWGSMCTPLWWKKLVEVKLSALGPAKQDSQVRHAVSTTITRQHVTKVACSTCHFAKNTPPKASHFKPCTFHNLQPGISKEQKMKYSSSEQLKAKLWKSWQAVVMVHVNQTLSACSTCPTLACELDGKLRRSLS